MTELESLRTRVEKTSVDLLCAIKEFEHAVADATTPEAAHYVASVIGSCYVAFDRVNSASVARLARVNIEADIAKADRG